MKELANTVTPQLSEAHGNQASGKMFFLNSWRCLLLSAHQHFDHLIYTTKYTCHFLHELGRAKTYYANTIIFIVDNTMMGLSNLASRYKTQDYLIQRPSLHIRVP